MKILNCEREGGEGRKDEGWRKVAKRRYEEADRIKEKEEGKDREKLKQ